MSQYDYGTIDPNAKSGTQLAVDLNNWRDALHSGHRGAERPLYAQAGMLWVRETSSEQWDLMFYDGDSDFVLRSVNPATDQLIGIPMGEISGLTDDLAGLTDDLAKKVDRDSAAGAAAMPSGTEAQRPASPVNGMFRYNSEKHQFEGYQDGKWGAVGGGGDHVLSVRWEASRSNIGDGGVAGDGQLLSRATYPDAWAAIAAGKVPVVTDAEWLADPTKRGCFTPGNGTSTFRLPDYNGKFAGSLGAVFLRGDGALSAAIAGTVQLDAFKEHQHESNILTSTAAGGYVQDFGAGTPRSSGRIPTESSNSYVRSSALVSSSGGAETRPLNVTGCWVIKLFGAVVNVGSADAAQLASDYANLAGRASTLESMPGLGWGQTWQNVTLSRSSGTTYTNTTGRPIVISVTSTPSNTGKTQLNFSVNGVQVARSSVPGSGIGDGPNAWVTGIVPPGGTYVVTNVSSGSIGSWGELR